MHLQYNAIGYNEFNTNGFAENGEHAPSRVRTL